MTYAGETENMVYDNDALLVQRGSKSIIRNTANGLAESANDGNYTQTRSYNSYGERWKTSSNRLVIRCMLSVWV